MIEYPETLKYLFERHPEVEVSHNWLLAGVLTIDIPKAALPLTKHRRQGIDAIVAQLIVESQMGDWGTDTAALGGPWPDDARYSDDALRAWAARSTTARLAWHRNWHRTTQYKSVKVGKKTRRSPAKGRKTGLNQHNQ